jgi:hypothetical protein
MAQEPKRSVEEWKNVVARWKESGASQRGFCRSQGISFSAFSYWIRKVDETRSVSLVKIAGSKRSAVTLAHHGPIVVRAGAIRLELTGEESEATMMKVFRALEAASCSSI